MRVRQATLSDSVHSADAGAVAQLAPREIDIALDEIEKLETAQGCAIWVVGVAIVFDFPVAWIVWNAWVEGEFGNSAARELHVILALSAVLMTIFGSLSLRSTRRELAEKRSDVDQWLRESDT